MDEKSFDSINVIPFVDIMLVLLTIVLTTSSFIASGRIPVNLPKATKSAEVPQAARIIEVNKGGEIYWNGQVKTPEALKSELSGLEKDTALLIRADKDVVLQRFIDVADALKQLGFTKVAVQTEGH